MELLTVLFLNNLAQEAKAKAFEERSATIRAHHVKAVAKVILQTVEILCLYLSKSINMCATRLLKVLILLV